MKMLNGMLCLIVEMKICCVLIVIDVFVVLKYGLLIVL